MSAHAHRGFATTTAIAIEIPNIAGYALAVLILGLLMAAGGTAVSLRASAETRQIVSPTIALRVQRRPDSGVAYR
jgi:hypothetical protein